MPVSINRLKWYFARLAAMSPAEVLHRLREAGLKQAFKGNDRGWSNVGETGTGALADLGWLRRRLAGAVGIKDGLALLDAGVYAGLGRQIRADDPSRWFRDPVSGGVWPSTPYCFSVDVRATGGQRGDVKFVWEINRLQMLHPLAAAVAAGHEPPARLLAVLRDWAAANPPFCGVNWFSGIELAMRMVTFTLVIAAIDPAALEPDDRRFLRQMIGAHGFWLARYPSKFSSANNHLVAEGLGLLLAGLLAPNPAGPLASKAAAWEAEGRHILETEAALQILGDGVGAEQSPTYQAFTMEMLGFAALVAEQSGRPLAPVVERRLRQGAGFLRTLMDGAGLPPRIGDDDEGRVLAAPPDREPRYVASVVAAIAGLTGDVALLPPGRDPHLRDAVFATPAGTASAADGVSTFPDGGYSVVRETIADRAMVLTFDHGPLGYLALAAHGHADALSVWLSLDDLPVLVDAGTYLYHSGGALRNGLRSGPAHNTLTLDRQSLAVPSSAFSWKSRTAGRLLSTRPGWSITAEHDGYARSHGVHHRRTISREAECILIADALAGATEAVDVEITFLAGPETMLTVRGGRIELSARGQTMLTLVPPPGFAVAIAEDNRERAMGLYSPQFGDITAARQIVLSGRLDGREVVTRLDFSPPGQARDAGGF